MTALGQRKMGHINAGTEKTHFKAGEEPTPGPRSPYEATMERLRKLWRNGSAPSRLRSLRLLSRPRRNPNRK
jgi:hypothetical protein